MAFMSFGQVEVGIREVQVDSEAIVEKSAGGGLWMTLRWQECRIITVPTCLTGRVRSSRDQTRSQGDPRGVGGVDFG